MPRPPSQNAVRRWHSLLPAEILSIIFLLVVEYEWDDDCRMTLMLVCRDWCDIMLSNPGIPSELWIRKSTTVELVRAAIQRTRWLLFVNIDVDDGSIGQDSNAGAIEACFMAAIETASRWRSLSIYSVIQPRNFKAF